MLLWVLAMHSKRLLCHQLGECHMLKEAQKGLDARAITILSEHIGVNWSIMHFFQMDGSLSLTTVSKED